MYKSSLRTPCTREEAEALNMVDQPDLGPEPVPFGFIHGKWQRLLAQQQPGDELWTFESDFESWVNMAGRKGIALVRQGEVVAYIVTRMN